MNPELDRWVFVYGAYAAAGIVLASYVGVLVWRWSRIRKDSPK